MADQKETCKCSLNLSPRCLGKFFLDSSFVISKDEFFGLPYLNIMEEWKDNKTLELSEKVRIINIIRQKVLRYAMHKPICPECAKVARETLGQRAVVPCYAVKKIRVEAQRALRRDNTEKIADSFMQLVGLTT
ncbi:hypothetical protein L6248_00310 [Candidatus Parcubacteria bacterium]|nr:hypothetical protein [Candidatus Parcubacteria bacterium]MCG2701417.1 hypothetical protein [Candidatus Parcubacteria bacterium]